MKVLIGTGEVCGQIHDLGKEFKRQGYDVCTVADTWKFESYNYDFSLKELHKYEYLKSKVSFTFLYKVIIRSIEILEHVFKIPVGNWIYRRNYRKLLKGVDVFIKMWSSFEPDFSDLSYMKKRGIKVVTLFVGSDVRHFDTWNEQFGFEGIKFPDNYKKPLEKCISTLRVHEKYSDLIFTIPEVMGLALKPYAHFIVPVDVENINYKLNETDNPLVLHAPTNPEVKGTEYIERAISNLKEMGLKFRFQSIRGLEKNELLKLLEEADILVDQVLIHGPGSLGFEAMAAGCVAMTRHYQPSPPCFQPPVININVNNVEGELEKVILDKDYREDLIKKGRNYMLENNTVDKVVNNIVSKLNETEDELRYDYFPTYFREVYSPKSQHEFLNQWTGNVMDCDWYKKYISKGERDGLIF